jgi:anti-anti-sigma regulatory factor
MLRFSIARSRFTLRISVEGSITAQSAPLIEQECRTALDQGDSVELDLQKVTFVDARGAALLRRLQRRRVAIVRCPRFILEFVRKDPPATKPD